MINVAIVGYGNLGRACEYAIAQNKDMNLAGIFTRREPKSIKTRFINVKADKFENLKNYKGKIDVCILCGGSKRDVRAQMPQIITDFNCIDSFDTHADILEYIKQIEPSAQKNKKLAIVSNGWDPGLFSVLRTYFAAVLPEGAYATFWGPGVSEGHSDAIRMIAGVRRAVQYTIPKQDAVNRALKGESVSKFDAHLRKCFVAADMKDRGQIEKAIRTMPNYFEGCDVEINFITEEEFAMGHGKLPHGGTVLANGMTGGRNKAELKLDFKTEDNPGFTANCLVAAARACCKMKERGICGVITPLDIAPIDLLPEKREEVIKKLL